MHVVRVEKEQNKKYLNKSIDEIAGMHHKDPEDAILDLGLDENLEIGITLSVINVNKEIVEKLLNCPTRCWALGCRRARRATLRCRAADLPPPRNGSASGIR